MGHSTDTSWVFLGINSVILPLRGYQTNIVNKRDKKLKISKAK